MPTSAQGVSATTPLTLAVGRRPHARASSLRDALLDAGRQVAVDEVSVVNRAFRQMVREAAYDVCEMSFATYLCAREHGARLVGLPVFLMRGLAHEAILRAVGGPVSDPHELESTSVGTHNGYTATTGLWAREVLHSEYGVDLSKITWVRAGDEHVLDYRPPGNVTSLPNSTSLRDALMSGDIAAAVGTTIKDPSITTLIPDARRVALRAVRDQGFYPVNHLVVVREELAERDPDLVIDVFAAFSSSKRAWLRLLRSDALVTPTASDVLFGDVWRTCQDDPLPYGIEPNQAMLERVVDAALQQGVIRHRAPVDSLFAPSSFELVG